MPRTHSRFSPYLGSVANLLFGRAAATRSASRFLLPQAKPARGPWYEGWYVRVTDAKKDFSFATISTSDTPREIPLELGTVLPGYLAFVYREPGAPLTRTREFFPERTFARLNPPDRDFSWTAEGFGQLTEREVEFTLPEGEEISIRFGERRPWNAGWTEGGPAGLGLYLPGSPVYWYVDSIGTPVEYRVKLASGQVVEGRGLAHVEKNWGRIFPRAWMWLQGISAGGDDYVALAGGVLPLVGSLEVTGYYVGYRSPRVEMDIRPDQLSRYETEIDAARGRFRVDAYNLWQRIRIEAEADPASFGPVSIPTPNGYTSNGGIESFSASIRASAYRAGKIIDEISLEGGALEFGADNMRAAPSA